MPTDATTIEVTWIGPYSWPKYEKFNDLPSIPKIPGVYLQTFEYQDGYLISCAGVTRRPAPERFSEHTAKFINGEYTVLDINAAQQGVRKEIWHGWGYAREHREEFEKRKPMIVDAVTKQLAGYRIFIADVGTQSRILERLEASIMNNLYRQPPPICDLPDKEMQLSSRWSSETLIIVKNNCKAVLYGLTKVLEI